MIKFFAILILQVIYMPALTLRTTFSIKGNKVNAALMGCLESIIYIASLGIVFSDLSNISSIVAYIIGYALGIYIGCKIEEKMALGYRAIQVNLTNENKGLCKMLREKGFGVTSFIGQGINEEERYRLEIISHRNREKEVINLVTENEPNAFVVSYEPTQFKGGYFNKQINRYKR